MARSGAKQVELSFSAGKLTHFGGVYLLHHFLQQLHMRTFLAERLRMTERNNHFTLTEHLFALIYPMILGLDTIELSTLLGANGVFQYLTGLPSFPKPNTLRRFLTDKTTILLPRLRSAHNKLRSRFIILPNAHSSYWLDFDSTAKTLYGHQEGVVKGYNPGHPGKKSYHPLVCTEARLKDCLGGVLRYGNAHTADGVLPMLDTALLTLPSATREIRVRADAGFYDKAFISRLSDKHIGFSVVAHLTAPLKDCLPGLRYHKVTKVLSTSELKYQPHNWAQPYRFVVLREKLSEERKEQLTLFTANAYSYHVIVTNLKLTPYGVFDFYRNRTGLERIIRSLKEDYPFARAVTGSFAANSLYAELSLLAYDIVIWFKRLCLPEDWQSYTAGTLRHRLLLIPGIFTKTGNRPKLKLPKSSPYQETFLYAQQQISKLRSLVE